MLLNFYFDDLGDELDINPEIHQEDHLVLLGLFESVL